MKKTFFLVLVLCIAFLSSPVWADARQEADQAFATWREALSSNKPDNVVNLYAPDAVLLATLANKPITNHHDRMAYFTQLMKRPNLSVKVDEEFGRVLSDNAVALSGLYTFSFQDQPSVTVKVPARYTFVFVKNQDNTWQIVEHHSSKLPERAPSEAAPQNP